MTQKTHQRVRDLLADKMNMDVPTPDLNLMENGYLDSLSFVKMLTLLEEEFDIRISMDDLDFEYFQTVDGIASFVQQKLEVKTDHVG